MTTPDRQQVANLGASYRKSAKLRNLVHEYAEQITKQTCEHAEFYREELAHLELLSDFTLGVLLLTDWVADPPTQYLAEIGGTPRIHAGPLDVH